MTRIITIKKLFIDNLENEKRYELDVIKTENKIDKDGNRKR